MEKDINIDLSFGVTLLVAELQNNRADCWLKIDKVKFTHPVP
jgi:hypothetical protein